MITKIILILLLLILMGGAYFGVQIILKSSRDTIRIADIEAINTAFEQNAYKSQEDIIIYNPLTQIDFPKGIPKDPLNDKENGYVYTFKIGEEDPSESPPSKFFYSYVICAKLEYEIGNAKDNEGNPPKANKKAEYYCQKSPPIQ